MNVKIATAFVCLGALVFAAGCVNTVDGRKTGGFPAVKDSFGGQYERTVDQVCDASKEVLKYNGTLVNEATLYSATNSTIRTLEGKVNDRRVWVRVQPVDSKVTSVRVQARTPGGGTDLSLVHEIEKQIALKLVGP